MGVVCGTDDVPTMCVVLDRDGEYVDSLKLSHFYKLRTTRTDAVDAHGESVYEVVDTDRHKARLKEGESKQLEEFILTHEPNVIGVGAMVMREGNSLFLFFFSICCCFEQKNTQSLVIKKLIH